MFFEIHTNIINKKIYLDIEVYYTGYCFFENSFHKEDEFSQLIISSYLEGKDLDFNGNYAIIIKTKNSIVLSVDKVRSIPLFYYVIENKISVTNNARLLPDIRNNKDIDELAKLEILYAGYVTGSETLYPEIKQLLPGEIINFNLVESKLQKKSHRYFEYLPEINNYKLENDLIDIGNIAIKNSIKRLIKSTKNRTLVVPLSGGLDSRLIVSELKKQNYTNVICYSYGKIGNSESKISESIAKKLGYKWIFIPYTRNLWEKLSKSNEYKKYFLFSDNFSSVPHIQDFPAVMFLKNEKHIPEDSVFVPGHTGDFISGGHIPLFIQSNFNDINLFEFIISKYFRIHDFEKLNIREKKLIINKVKSTFSNLNITDSDKASEMIEYYDWQERQSKHILNSLRVYEYSDYDWRIPLWDDENIAFWKSVPYKYKLGKVLFKKILSNNDSLKVFPHLKNTSIITTSSQKPNNFLKYLNRRQKFMLKVFKKQFYEYYNHPMQWYGMFNVLKVIFKWKFQNIYTFLNIDYIKSFKKDI